jgi:hypothetical protein
MKGSAVTGSRPAMALGLSAYAVLRQAADVWQALTVVWVVASGTGSARAVAAVWVGGVVPWFLLPASGVAADRLAKRNVVLAADLVASVCALAMAAAVRRGASAVLAVGWAAIYGLCYATARPATKGLSREVAPVPEGAARLVGTLTAVEYAAILAAQGVAGTVLLAGAPWRAFLAVAAALGVGAVVLSCWVPAGLPRVGEVAGRARETVRLLFQPPFRGPFALTVVCGTCGFAAQLLTPLLAQRQLGAGPVAYAWLAAATSAGSCLGALWAGRGRLWRLGTAGSAWVWLAAAPAVAWAGASHALAPTAMALSVVGMALGAQDAGNAARIAALVPPAVQSQAMGLGSLVWRLPKVLAGPVAALADATPLGGLLLALALTQAIGAAGGLAVAAWKGKEGRLRRRPR